MGASTVCFEFHFLGRNTENHQMTGNYMWDMESNKEFLIGSNPDSRLPLWWNGSEPLWVTMEKLNKSVYMYYWPGLCHIYKHLSTKFCLSNSPHSLLGQFNTKEVRHLAVSLHSSIQGHLARYIQGSHSFASIKFEDFSRTFPGLFSRLM